MTALREKPHHPVYTTTGPEPDRVTGLDLHALDDWRDALAAFVAEFEDRRVPTRAGAALFPGRNMMTEDVLGYVHTPDGIAEVSTSGRGLLTDHRVFGVTFADYRADELRGGDTDPSRFCEEWGDVVDACNGRRVRPAHLDPERPCPYCGPGNCRGSARTADGHDVERFENVHRPR